MKISTLKWTLWKEYQIIVNDHTKGASDLALMDTLAFLQNTCWSGLFSSSKFCPSAPQRCVVWSTSSSLFEGPCFLPIWSVMLWSISFDITSILLFSGEANLSCVLSSECKSSFISNIEVDVTGSLDCRAGRVEPPTSCLSSFWL